MREYEVCLGPILLPNERGAYDLVASGETITVKAQTCAIVGDHLILKDAAGVTRFISNRNDVRYCRVIDSIKGPELSAVSCINSGDAASDKGDEG